MNILCACVYVGHNHRFFCLPPVSPSSARVILAPDAVLDDDVDVTPDVASPDGVLCDVAGCEYDLQLYCLNNGVIVMGSCSLKNTLCKSV